jgi:hypothetical protein
MPWLNYKAPFLVRIWGFCISDIQKKHAICFDCRFWQDK